MNPTEERLCKKCNEVKPLNEFNKHRWCKLCSNAYSREHYHSNKEEYKEKHDLWLKDNPDYKSQYYQAHLNYHKEYHSLWYSLNLSERKSQLREYYQKNKTKYLEANHRRRSKRDGEFSWIDFEKLCLYYNYRCLCCGKYSVKLEADHVIPIHLGGKNVIENIQPLCGFCNRSKGVNVVDFRLLQRIDGVVLL